VSCSVIVVGHGAEPLLAVCLEALRQQLAPQDELVLVDHGIDSMPSIPGVHLVTPTANRGFGAGCAEGVDATTNPILVFVNSDAVVGQGAVTGLSRCVEDETVGLAGGLVLLEGRADTVNSVGLPVHLSGLSWCGAYGQPIQDFQHAKELTSVAGALFAIRREVWERLGGMDSSYFMYHEDTDLSLRCHLAGLRVVYCPDAVASHAYEFSKNPRKMFLLERNRLLTVLGDYPAHLLLRTLPIILALEPLYFLVALRDGWAKEKLDVWAWLLTHRRQVQERRRRVQSQVVDPTALDALLVPEITQAQLDRPRGLGLINGLLRAYWKVASPVPGERVGRRSAFDDRESR